MKKTIKETRNLMNSVSEYISGRGGLGTLHSLDLEKVANNIKLKNSIEFKKTLGNNFDAKNRSLKDDKILYLLGKIHEYLSENYPEYIIDKEAAYFLGQEILNYF